MQSNIAFPGVNLKTIALPICAFVLFVFILLWFERRPATKGGLPGPPTLPVLGNLHQIPSTGLYKKFDDWSRQFGSVFRLKFGSSNVVVLCDRKAVHDLLDKRGNIYSDRPQSYMNLLLGTEENAFMLPMNDIWKIKRKAVSHNLSPAQLDKKHFRVQEAEATVLMHDFLEAPDKCDQHIRRYAASIVHVLIHGFRAKSADDYWSQCVYTVMHSRTICLEPGSRPPFDEFPILKYLPRSWFSWYKKAQVSCKVTQDTWNKCGEKVRRRRSLGDRRDCIADDLLDQYEASGWPLSQLSFNMLLGEMVEGGADTSAGSLRTLMLALVAYPEVQAKAQAEIDAVCGTSRSPQWSDFESLPYVNMLVKEGLRWRPVAPTALPHQVRQDDVYEGMKIGKDSTVFIGVWSLHHDPNHFPNPDQFNPERYRNHDKLANHYAGSPDYLNRDHYAYGAGRRICPGIHLAERNMWRTVAKLLWAFSFSEAKDANGRLIPMDPDSYTNGLTREPKPYKLHVRSRSAEHAETIKKELVGALEFLKQFE